jgi:hypothetical protein
MPNVAEVHGQSALSTACTQCGHNWGEHEMHAAVMPYPTDGWITCPAVGCECHSTWSVDEESRPVLERHRAEYLAREQQGGAQDPAG